MNKNAYFSSLIREHGFSRVAHQIVYEHERPSSSRADYWRLEFTAQTEDDMYVQGQFTSVGSSAGQPAQITGQVTNLQPISAQQYQRLVAEYGGLD